MKKFYPFYAVVVFIVLLLAACFGAKAQGIYQLWGAMPYGGAHDGGVLFSAKYDGTAYTEKKQFTVTNPGGAGDGNRPVVFGNKFYAALFYGGLANAGIIGEFDPVTDAWVKKADLYTIGGSQARGSLVAYNGKLYGVCGAGGANNQGLIFEFNPATSGLSAVHHFALATGGFCAGGLVLFNNKLYGTAAIGGAHSDGVLFEFDPATTVYTKKIDLHEATHGKNSYSSLTVYNGNLWGTFNSGGLANKGTLCTYDPVANTISKREDFAAASVQKPRSRLTVLNNKLYGYCEEGGSGFGGLFVFNPLGDNFSVVHNLAATDGRTNVDMTVYNGKLYGTGAEGGTQGGGTLFYYNPATDEYGTEVDLFKAIGRNPNGGMLLHNNKFYGFNSSGANHDRGSLFYFNPAENGYVSLVHFGGPELTTPEGDLVRYNNKLYGTASTGGAHQNGGIYEYDLATGVYTLKVSLTDANGRRNLQGGFTAVNNKLYGVARFGGATDNGALYEYDPATNGFAKKHDFSAATGSHPVGALTLLNGKLYGTCTEGSTHNEGNLYEYDPAAGSYTQKVIMGANFGTRPQGTLAVYNNKLYGTCAGGGAAGNGTLFEYTPGGNAFQKKVDFTDAHGRAPKGGLTVFDNKLYGLTSDGGILFAGTLYEYNPATATLLKKVDLTPTTGGYTPSRLTLIHNKMIGLTDLGGANYLGTVIRYDPATNSLVKIRDMEPITGSRAGGNSAIAVPAPTAPGSPNSCLNTQPILINAANATEWIPFTDAEGRAVGEINANGNVLGITTVKFYVHSGPTRQAGNGMFYLDRNITITPATQPTSPVSIRLYVKKTEFDALKATAGSGVTVPSSIAIFGNNDFCSATLNAATTPISALHSDWGFDYVYTASVSSLASFYFAARSNVALPVHLLTFSGKRDGAVNRLSWKATCTSGVNFTVERSADGTHFVAIGLVLATQPDCDKTFTLPDAAPLPAKSYYRLGMKEDNGAVSYSQVVVIDRTPDAATRIQLAPNPVIGASANLQVTATKNGSATVTLTDATGKTVSIQQAVVGSGTNTIPVKTSKLPAGGYLLIYQDETTRHTTRFVKQ